ncbi:arylsulfatase [Pseudomonas oryzihabitans]|nr:arylsulfatase [Pseudomonas psychrotolerans]
MLTTSILLAVSSVFATEPVRKPNILLIVADDLGFSDLSALGSEITTPNLDSLIKQGKLLLDFHTAPSCSPTRAMLMSGNDPHLVGLGMMAETRQRVIPQDQAARDGYAGVLLDNVATLSELLQDSDYRTYIAGKWHLGKEPAQQPQNRGFDEAYVLLEGGASHFKQANMSLMPGTASTYLYNGKPIELPEDFYSTQWYTERLLHLLKRDQASSKPFFAFAAYTSPHWPLQAPDSYLEKYRGRYDKGYEVIGKERLERQRAAGLVPADYPSSPQLIGVPSWDSLSTEQQQRSARTMEAYAAMVESLDAEVGRLVGYLRETRQLDDTLIIFMSDNGAEHADRVDPKWIKANFDNSLENYGRRDSFLMEGSAWAQVSSLPSQRYKMTTYQGGIRVPAFVHFPGTVRPGVSDQLASVRDIMPTLLQLAGTPMPGITYRNRNIVPPQGTSMLDHLQGKDERVHAIDEALGWEINGYASLRRGSMKLLFDPEQAESGWQLFDLSKDPGERHDLANEQPATRDALLRDWRAYAQRNNIALGADARPVFPAKAEHRAN